MKKFFWPILLLLFVLIGTIALISWQKNQKSLPFLPFIENLSLPNFPSSFKKEDEKSAEKKEEKTKNEKDLAFPVDEFEQRITLKPFGLFVSPQNSPVIPERFKGFHTGVDVEYEDVNEPVPVFAISDGVIVFGDFVNGYGGTLVLKLRWENQDLFALYGHLDQETFTNKKEVSQGERIAFLGENNSFQTDGERKHLHFGLSREKLNLRGYVDSKEELGLWLDPLEFFGPFL